MPTYFLKYFEVEYKKNVNEYVAEAFNEIGGYDTYIEYGNQF